MGLASILITYLGTACFLMDVAGTRILTDPGDLLTARLTEDRARSLRGIDLVLVTHADPDHTNRLRSIPGIGSLPVLAPETVKRRFPDLTVLTDREYRLGGITVHSLPSVHGLRRAVDHRAYEISGGGRTIVFLGDAVQVQGAVTMNPDALFVTIGGLDADIRNALAIVRSVRPRTVIPMHWEGLFRQNRKARDFARALALEPAAPLCIIPEPGVPVEIPGR